MHTVFAPKALLQDGWAEQVVIECNDSGNLTRVQKNVMPPSNATRCRGPVLPGMPNLHSHAFQRAMAGLAEVAINPEDSFWTWRDLMYRLVSKLSPDHIEDIAYYLYIEMLKGGYTSVAEFHYLHHDLMGQAYNDPAELSRRILRAAQRAGIGITLLPVLYAHSGFGGQEPTDGQKRFLNSYDSYLKIQETLGKDCAVAGRRLGFCFHSLRAVTQQEILAVIGSVQDDRPIHIHIAEQQQEVDDCLAWSGRRPIQWLYENINVDSRWCLIHATHTAAEEIVTIAKSKAVVGLCPTTEANLGDGLFPAVDFINHGGRFGIGSDSHVSLSVVEELRWLEYGQRLKYEKRNRLHDLNKHVAGYLYRSALAGGAQALGQKIGVLAVGNRADMIVLDGNHPLLAHVKEDDILGRWLFAGDNKLVQDVMVGGNWVIQDGRHKGEIEAAHAFANTLKTII